jgi:hypothetical protein
VVVATSEADGDTPLTPLARSVVVATSAAAEERYEAANHKQDKKLPFHNFRAIQLQVN